MSTSGRPIPRPRQEDPDSSDDEDVRGSRQVKLAKVNKPDNFNSNRKKTKEFLTQARLYLFFNNNKFLTEQH